VASRARLHSRLARTLRSGRRSLALLLLNRSKSRLLGGRQAGSCE
jgi:hypothetical protein